MHAQVGEAIAKEVLSAPGTEVKIISTSQVRQMRALTHRVLHRAAAAGTRPHATPAL